MPSASRKLVPSSQGSHLLGPSRIDRPLVHHVGSLLEHDVHLATLGFGERAEDELGGVLRPRRAAYPQLEPAEVGRAQGLLQRPDPVVATAPTVDLEPETAEGK